MEHLIPSLHNLFPGEGREIDLSPREPDEEEGEEEDKGSKKDPFDEWYEDESGDTSVPPLPEREQDPEPGTTGLYIRREEFDPEKQEEWEKTHRSPDETLPRGEHRID